METRDPRPDSEPVAHALFVECLVPEDAPHERERLLQELAAVIRATPEYSRGQSRGDVLMRNFDDGVALVFPDNPVAAAQCSADIARTVRAGTAHGRLLLRMGLHSGPHEGEGGDSPAPSSLLDTARRVAGWGDPGHILLSSPVADAMRRFAVWADYLHDLGPEQTEAPPAPFHLWNLHMGQVGNGAVPTRVAGHAAPISAEEPAAESLSHRPVPPQLTPTAAPLVAGSTVPVPPPVQVFLSHSSTDKAVADALVSALEGAGMRCWIAPRDIPPGVDWSAAIIGALNRCKVLVLVFSARANLSPQVIREVERAVSKRAAVLTFRVEDTPLSEQMEYFISASHWMDATADWTRQVPAVVPAVRALIDSSADSRLAMGLSPTKEAEKPAPSAATPEPPHAHLPLVPTTLFGRGDEVEGVRETLRGGTRLLTLTGFGGVGKTRVALEVARQSVDDYSGGVWWVELSETRTADAMLQHVAQGLGLRLQPPPPAREQIVGFLRDRHKTLLVLDNVEQIAGAENALRDLLADAPHLTLVITSRRTMGLRSETVREVRPLLPTEAIELFVERAQAVRDDFTLSDENRDDVETLVRSLEGVPLAIELAAARVVGMTPRQMVTRLSERFRLLQTRAPDLPERQRALRAAIDWSYDLLTEDDRSLFAQLSVFASGERGFTLEDVEAVCDVFDPFEGALTLRNHSLLVADTDDDTQENRYRLLESLRDYACERLRTDFSSLDRAVRERHARHFLKFAEERLTLLRTAREAEALDQLEDALDNLRVATDWAGTVGAPVSDIHARLALSLGVLMQKRGFQSEAVGPVEAGLASARPAAAAAPRVLLRLLCERAGLHLDLKEPEKARVRAQEALAMAREIGDLVGEADAENLLGQVDLDSGDFANARTHYRRALEIREAQGERTLIGIVRNNLGLVEIQDPGGDRQAARAHLEEALRIRRAAGDERGIAVVLNNLGNLAFEEQDWQRAQQAFQDAVHYESDVHHTFGVARALNNLAESVEEQDRPAVAVPLYAAAEMLFRDVKHAYADYSAERLQKAVARAEVPDAELSRLRRSIRGKRLSDIVTWAQSLLAAK